MIYGTFIKARGEFCSQLNFLSKAVSGDETRSFMQHIFVEPSEKSGEEGRFRGVSTDGRRLHLIDPLACPHDEFEAGLWAVLKTGKKETWIAKIAQHGGGTNKFGGSEFPAYRRVIPTGEPVYRTEFYGYSESGDRACDMVKFIRGFPDPTVFNLRYLSDLGSLLTWDVEWYESSKSVAFTSGDYFALIMPIKLTNERP
jgi:hypothetical protein